MSNMSTEDYQRALLQKKSAEMSRKTTTTQRTTVDTSNTNRKPTVRKATARKSTHPVRINTINQPKSNNISHSATATTNGTSLANRPTYHKETSSLTNKLNGVHRSTHQQSSITNKDSLHKNNLIERAKSSELNNKKAAKSTSSLIKETVQGIKGSLGLFLKAKKTVGGSITPSSSISNLSSSSSHTDENEATKHPSDKYNIDDYCVEEVADDLLPDDSPPDTSIVASDGPTTATTSEDAGSEEGLKLWLDESSDDTNVSSDDTAFVASCNSEMDSCSADLVYEDVQKHAAVALKRLPTGVMNKLTSSGRIKVHVKKATGDSQEDESPEVSVIDGIEFYSFETEEDLIEYTIQDQKLKSASGSNVVDESDVSAYAQPIIPTKTNDITQIKGWRSKIFAAETTQVQESEADNLPGTEDDGKEELPEEIEEKKEDDDDEVEEESETDREAEEESNDRSADEVEVEETKSSDEQTPVSVKTYGARRSVEEAMRFQDMYIEKKRLMPVVSKPVKTKYGWFQQYGCVRVFVGSVHDPAPTFSPIRPAYKYDTKTLKDIMLKNKLKKTVEVSLTESGLITPMRAEKALEALRIDRPTLVDQPIKTVIKIDETHHSPESNEKKSATRNGSFARRGRPPFCKKILAKPLVKSFEKPLIKSPESILLTSEKKFEDSFPFDNFSKDETVISEPPADYVETKGSPRREEPGQEKPECGNVFCKFGCVCDSLRVRKRKRAHCGRYDCMFNCDCGFTISSSCASKITSPSIQNMDRGDFDGAIQTDEGPVRRRRRARIPARLMDSDFICKSVKDLLELPEHLREKMHYEKRVYTKFDRHVYTRNTATRGGKRPVLPMTNGVSRSPRSPRSPEDQSNELRVPPIRIVNLKGNTYPKISPVLKQDAGNAGSSSPQTPESERSVNRQLFPEIFGLQHILNCGKTIVNGKVSLLSIPKMINGRAMLTVQQNIKGVSQVNFIRLELKNNTEVYCGAKGPINGRVIGYVVAHDSLRNALTLAKTMQTPTSSPVTVSIADFIRIDSNDATSRPPFNIYPIVKCSTHVFVGPFDARLAHKLCNSNHVSKKSAMLEVLKSYEVGKSIQGAVVENVCSESPKKSSNLSGMKCKVSDTRIPSPDGKNFKKWIISGNQIMRKRDDEKAVMRSGGEKRKASVANLNEVLEEEKKGERPKAKRGRPLLSEVAELARKRKKDLDLEKSTTGDLEKSTTGDLAVLATNRDLTVHAGRERLRRQREFKYLEILKKVLDPQNTEAKPYLIEEATKYILDLEASNSKMEKIKRGLLQRRHILFSHYTDLIKDVLPPKRQGEAIKEITSYLQTKNDTPTAAGPDNENGEDSDTSSLISSTPSGSSNTTDSSDSESIGGDVVENNKPTEEKEGTQNDLIMSVDQDDCAENTEETPGLFMYVEVDEETALSPRPPTPPPPVLQPQPKIVKPTLRNIQPKSQPQPPKLQPQIPPPRPRVPSIADPRFQTLVSAFKIQQVRPTFPSLIRPQIRSQIRSQIPPQIQFRLPIQTQNVTHAKPVLAKLLTTNAVPTAKIQNCDKQNQQKPPPNAVAIIPTGNEIVLHFNDAASLTSLLKTQTNAKSVMLKPDGKKNQVCENETNVELPKIVNCSTISEAEFWAPN